ncbi:DMT family transporter [Litoribacter ruber]|uniref:DMT family transporter n=1 Tax=Litoribacter ruber TaxID=702568 RepID=A0AAP2CH02_9BACT|nr:MULTISPECIES: DMT family transporter [Litoribacter]MBS9523046.1 DMT family transporter [Litoribacter alkaliphilus]MBT0810790.1 DMT family transporter [Litoribacter ruber]
MLRGVLLVFLGASSFGVLSSIVKLAYKDGFSLGEVTGVQAFFGTMLLWTIYFFQQKSKSVPRTKKAFKPKLRVILMGTSTGLVSIFYYKCVQSVPASIAILLLMQFTWMGVVLDMVFSRKFPSKLQTLSVIGVLLGTLLAGNVLHQGFENIQLVGIFYGLLAALSYSCFLMINNRVGNQYPPALKSALMLTGACILIFSIFPPVFLWNGSLGNGLLVFGILLALFGTVIPPLFFAKGIPVVGLTLSSILSAAELPVAVFMSWFILNETVLGIQWLGVILILAAIILPNALKLLTKSSKLSQKVSV